MRYKCDTLQVQWRLGLLAREQPLLVQWTFTAQGFGSLGTQPATFILSGIMMFLETDPFEV